MNPGEMNDSISPMLPERGAEKFSYYYMYARPPIGQKALTLYNG